MQPDKRTCKLLLKELRQCLPVPASLYDLSGGLLGCTDQEKLPLLEQLHKLYISASKDEAILRACGGACYALKDSAGEVGCYLLLLNAAQHPEYQSIVETLAELCFSNQALLEQQYTDSNDRLSFVYQLLSPGLETDDTIASRAAKLNYNSFLPRCAMIFLLADVNDDVNLTVSEEANRHLLQIIQETPEYNKNDFGDFLTNRQFILFKTTPDGDFETRRAYLTRYIEAILAEDSLQKKTIVYVGVGTVYQDLTQMRESYQEAQFVIKNLPVLDSPRQLGFVEDYTFDYLMSLLPAKQQHRHFEPLAEKIRAVSYLSETLKALVAQDCNLTHCARQLGIHRNTMRQRYTKLIETTGLDPLHSTNDMLTARQCAVYLNRKTVFHAGIIIQSNSDLHRGARRFSTLLEEKSGNTMSVEVLNVGLTGNNASLLDLLVNGTIDFIVIDPEPLTAYIGDKIAALNLPHIFDSYEEAYDLLNGPVGETLIAPMKDARLVNLGVFTMGWRYLSFREPVTKPEQMRGKRIRTMFKPLVQKYMDFLGAQPIPISYDNIMPALADNLVDAQENPYVNFKDMHFYDHHSFILEENSFLSTAMLITSQSLWNTLSADQQQIITEAAKETTQWQWRQTRQHNADVRERLIRKYGVQVYQPTPEEDALWREQAEAFKTASAYQDVLQLIDAAREERRHGSYPQNGL
ncbi:MAG: TRAP transporter substrate-binding protein DctP [Clostridia bacterium]|nr:TRAP transporter substrate-binding protein DctP [Clostridia bacterium]